MGTARPYFVSIAVNEDRTLLLTRYGAALAAANAREVITDNRKYGAVHSQELCVR